MGRFNYEDLSKEDLILSVQTLLNMKDVPHIHLNQHKLFTLCSISVQFLLRYSVLNPGSYILRIEDGILYDKLVKRSKDLSTRNFLQALLLPRKLKFKDSWFFLDFFNVSTWQRTNEIPAEKIKGALVIKNSTNRPMMEPRLFDEKIEEESILPKNFYHSSLQELSPKTIIIAFGETFDNCQILEFPWIKKNEEKISGVTFSKDLNLEIIK
ncbi:MAG: hypothetical protein ACHQYQ_01905 [Bacteriovoracales bacterium]